MDHPQEERATDTGVEVLMQVGSVGVHIKYEFEFSSTLAQKGLDPFTPHIEVDLTLPPVQVTGAGDGLSTTAMAQIVAQHTEFGRAMLEDAANMANAVAYAKLSDLLTQMRAAHKANAS